jgi:hypothetical protein
LSFVLAFLAPWSRSCSLSSDWEDGRRRTRIPTCEELGGIFEERTNANANPERVGDHLELSEKRC